MLAITKRDLISSIQGKNIYRVAAFQILPLALNENQLSENQVFYLHINKLVEKITNRINRKTKSRIMSICLRAT
jgi:hypothetical protein